jgi:tetraacyldisaccharide 4'-kinase
MKIKQLLVYPFSVSYGMVTFLRNKFFDWKILPSVEYDFPVISVGNLSAGGTGKSPLVAYIAGLLKGKNSIAILSRGYKRKTRGFRLASDRSTYHDIGDEPLQYKRNFGDVIVAVDESRRSGIKLLRRHFPALDAVILDDAFQHRYVKPGLSIITTDFHNLYANDFMIPSGTLREFRMGAKRADIIIVTKTPGTLSPITERRITGLLKPESDQHLFFTYIDYGELKPVQGEKDDELLGNCRHVLMFAGIANSYPLKEHLGTLYKNIHTLNFPDHHAYKPDDIKKLRKVFGQILSRNKIIVTTEKDFMRLQTNALQEQLAGLPLYYMPIQVKFHKKDNIIFDALIEDYVRENQRGHILSEGTHP